VPPPAQLLEKLSAATAADTLLFVGAVDALGAVMEPALKAGPESSSAKAEREMKLRFMVVSSIVK